jgi:hypothetical protein
VVFLAGQILTAQALNEVTDPPLLFTYQTTVQSIANITWTAINFHLDVYDTINGHSTVTNITRYTPNVSGTYDVEGQIAYAVNSTNDRGAQFRRNGSTIDGLQYGAARAGAGSSFASIATCSGVVFLNGSTDYIELYGFQESGGSLNTSYGAGFTTSFMKARRVGS